MEQPLTVPVALDSSKENAMNHKEAITKYVAIAFGAFLVAISALVAGIVLVGLAKLILIIWRA